MKTKAIKIRLATRKDVSEIVRLLADDVLGSKRERYEEPLLNDYYLALGMFTVLSFFRIIGSDFLRTLAQFEHQGQNFSSLAYKNLISLLMGLHWLNHSLLV